MKKDLAPGSEESDAAPVAGVSGWTLAGFTWPLLAEFAVGGSASRAYKPVALCASSEDAPDGQLWKANGFEALGLR